MPSPSFALAWAVALLGLASCGASKALLMVTDETQDGRVELTYRGEQIKENLIREVRFDAAGDTIAITQLMKGVLHGELTSFHPSGTRKESVNYANGFQDGLFRAFDTEGTVVFEGLLKEGKKQGAWNTWYDATQMRQQCHYKNDVLSGKCTYWFIDGNLQREETYSDGKLVASRDH